MNSVSTLAFSLGLPEAVVILGVLLLLFGAKKLPDLAKGMGQGIKEFKKASKEPAPSDEEAKGSDDTKDV